MESITLVWACAVRRGHLHGQGAEMAVARSCRDIAFDRWLVHRFRIIGKMGVVFQLTITWVAWAAHDGIWILIFAIVDSSRDEQARGWQVGLVEPRSQCVVCSVQQDSHANVRHTRIVGCASHQALVAVACTQHLPAEAPARAAHPHST